MREEKMRHHVAIWGVHVMIQSLDCSSPWLLSRFRAAPPLAQSFQAALDSSSTSSLFNYLYINLLGLDYLLLVALLLYTV